MGADLVRRLRVGLGGLSWEEVDITDAVLCVAAGANEEYERLVAAAHPGKFWALHSEFVGEYGMLPRQARRLQLRGLL